VRTRYYFIIVPLLVSLFIYLFYRTEKTVINEIAIRIISFGHYSGLKESVVAILPLNDFVIYSLPEGLWVFCITLTSKPYYFQQGNRRIPCAVIPLICCISLEIFQLLHVTNGRFDPMDIWTSVLFWALAHYLFGDESEKRNILKPLNLKSMACFISYGIVYLSHVLE
jgi:hypothetical protein